MHDLNINYPELWRREPIRQASEQVGGWVSAVEEEALAIQQIPAPTWHEAARARYVAQRFEALGLAAVEVDASSNVYGCVPGREPSQPALLVSAHLDTVFDDTIDLSTRRTERELYGPGIGDNSLGVAGLLALAQYFVKQPARRTIWFVANVGEEGMGNLNGMWTVTRRLAPQLGAVVVLEGGAFGMVIHRGIGVERRRLTVETPGGHAWSDFGTPSAIHLLCEIGAQIAVLGVPEVPRTTYNLGTIQGGSSVNTIAARATALLDLRSESPTQLEQLASQIDRILGRAGGAGVTVQSEVVGRRPSGGIPPSHPLVRVGLAALEWVGHPEGVLRAASTDANVPLSMSIPAICIGLTMGHNAHRLDEYIEREPLARGLRHAWLVIYTTAEVLL